MRGGWGVGGWAKAGWAAAAMEKEVKVAGRDCRQGSGEVCECEWG